MNYIISASTDVGIKKDTNQDSYFVQTVNTLQGKMVIAALCDGMGGLAKGEVASASLVNAFQKWGKECLPNLCSLPLTDGDIRREWTKIATEYNTKIKNYGKSYAVSMGTTVTALLLTQQRYYIMNVGDTRAYEIGQQVKLLTKDQTVVAREVELGLITEEQARNDSRRSVLLQCIGASDEVYPEFFFGETLKDSVYMLCSDGFRHEISEEEIFSDFQPGNMMNAEMMRTNERKLIELNKQRQERDNITVVTIRTF